MSNYRRCYVPGGSYYFTVVTEGRAQILGTDLARDLLRAAFLDCFQRWPPIRVDAMVMLREHMHAIWTLPPEDDDYPKRWGAIKKHFTQHWLALGGAEKPCSPSRIAHRRRGVWQRYSIEHTLRDQKDYQRHFDYIHFNPVKHGLVLLVTSKPGVSGWKLIRNAQEHLGRACRKSHGLTPKSSCSPGSK